MQQIRILTAPEVTGPWTPSLLVDLPAFETTIPPWGWHPQESQPKQNLLYYAAKLHPELSSNDSDELVVTYCSNVLGAFPAPVEYIPRFVRVSLKQDK